MAEVPLRPSSQARYIAVEGPPGAGVGALAERLAQAMGAQLVRDPTGENPFLDGFAKKPRQFAFQAQLYFLLERYRQQGNLVQGDLFNMGGVVADYLFVRDRLWAQIALSADEFALYENVYQLLKARVQKPDLVVYLTARPEVLRSRLAKRVRPTDRVVQTGYIDKIAAAMGDYFFQYEASPLLVVNTSELDYAEEPEQLDQIVQVISKTRAGVNHYNPAVLASWA